MKNVFAVHMERSTAAPGTKYTESALNSPQFVEALKKAGLEKDQDKVTSHGYDDVTIEYDDAYDAVMAARALKDVLPPVSAEYARAYFTKNVQISFYRVEEDPDKFDLEFIATFGDV